MKDKPVSLGIDREILIITEIIMVTTTSNKIIVGEISMIITEGMTMDDRVVITDTKDRVIKDKLRRIIRTIKVTKGINIISNIINKVTKLHLMEISSIKGKIIKCNHISTGREEKISNKDKFRDRDKINTITKTTIREITISNNSQDTITIIIIKEIIIHTTTIITITTDYEKKVEDFIFI